MKTNIPSITIYTTKNCPYSKRLRDWLYENEIAHTEVDLAQNPIDINKCFKLAETISTPVIDIIRGNRHMVLKGWSNVNEVLFRNYKAS